MKIEVIKATIDQRPILANLLELYTYDFTEFCDFDIGDDGRYGYEYLPLYWTESTRFPFLIYVDEKLAGFVFVQRGCPISDDEDVWDISEFFVMKKYKRLGVGSSAALKIWSQFKGRWQVRVQEKNFVACSFWFKAIKKFISAEPIKTTTSIKGVNRIIYSFESKSGY